MDSVAAELVAAVRVDPAGTLVALDFDGTLAPIVADPERSRPLPGAIGALAALGAAGVRLAVITGRDAGTAVRLGGLDAVPGLTVAGLYGAELWQGGELETMPTPPVLTELAERLPGVVAGADPAVWIEDKRLSLVVHGRRASDPEAALDPLRGPVAALAADLGLEMHPGRGVLEVRLPGYDKGTALRRLVERHSPRVVVFAGDDRGDVPGLLAVRSLRAQGVTGFAVAAVSGEVPELADAADILVDGPAGVLDILRRLTDGVRA